MITIGAGSIIKFLIGCMIGLIIFAIFGSFFVEGLSNLKYKTILGKEGRKRAKWAKKEIEKITKDKNKNESLEKATHFCCSDLKNTEKEDVKMKAEIKMDLDSFNNKIEECKDLGFDIDKTLLELKEGMSASVVTIYRDNKIEERKVYVEF